MRVRVNLPEFAVCPANVSAALASVALIVIVGLLTEETALFKFKRPPVTVLPCKLLKSNRRLPTKNIIP